MEEKLIKLRIQIYERNSNVCYFIADENGNGQEYKGSSQEWIQRLIGDIIRCSEAVKKSRQK